MSKTRAEILIELQHRLGPSENTAHLLDWILDLWETRDFLLKRLEKEYTESIISAVESSSCNFQPQDLVPFPSHHFNIGNDYDFLIPKEGFRRLRRHFPDTFFTNAYGDAGIRVGEYAFYESQFGFIYFQLERDAIDHHDYLVAHLEFLLFLETLTLVYDPDNQKARQDLVLLMQKLGVQPFPSENRPDPNTGEKRNEA